jgi:DNA-binding MarR family transcriptional regulator
MDMHADSPWWRCTGKIIVVRCGMRSSELARPRVKRKMNVPTQIHESLPYLMNRLLASLNRDLDTQLRAMGYTIQEWRVLATLCACGSVTLNRLVEVAVVPQPTVSRLIARLVERGLVDRSAVDGDARLVEASITPRGRTAVSAMLPVVTELHERVMQGFTEEQQRRLMVATQRMMRNAGLEP